MTNRNHIRQKLRIRLLDKSKSNNYSELAAVNVADGWRERLRSYLGRSHGRAETIRMKYG
ncbi:MAG: arginase [Clostridia bacterium]|nr:arginase [Clostridia bacterium]